MRVSAIIEARMGSTRLPGKVMMEIGGRPLLEKLVQRLRNCLLIDTIIIATPDTSDNLPIWDWAVKQEGLKLHKGPEDDVLKRVLDAANDTRTDIIVEVTGDEPLIDSRIVDLVCGYLICGDYEFCGNIGPGELHTWPKGMDVRVFGTKTLEKVGRETLGETYHRENVSTWMYRTDSTYKRRLIEAPDEETYPQLNLSVDTAEDFRRVKDIWETMEPMDPNFTIGSILKYLAILPGTADILAVPQKQKEAAWMSMR